MASFERDQHEEHVPGRGIFQPEPLRVYFAMKLFTDEGLTADTAATLFAFLAYNS